jgi:hypothetical protein
MSKKSINNSMDIPKLRYDSVNRRSNIYDVERSLDSYIQQNYVTLYDCISTKNLAAIKLPNQKLLSLAVPAPAPADAGAAPVGVPNVDPAAPRPDFATLVTTCSLLRVDLLQCDRVGEGDKECFTADIDDVNGECEVLFLELVHLHSFSRFRTECS